MKIVLAFPVLPPKLDGIGDYTACLAKTLAHREADVHIITTSKTADPIPGVTVNTGHSFHNHKGDQSWVDAILEEVPDWLILQYNPFSFGRWGLNLNLPRALRRLKQSQPAIKVALMVHEPFVPVESWKWAIMTTWQRWQLRQLGVNADQVFFSIEPWAHKFEKWFSGTPVAHLPVGSNMPFESTSRTDRRRALGFQEDSLVIGVFGSAHPSRLLPFIKAAVDAISSEHANARLLYIGADGKKVHEAIGHKNFVDAGPLAPEDVSRHFSAMDLYLAPFKKGVSSRRGSFMVGIQHGVATVSTSGIQSDSFLLEQHEKAMLLASDQDPVDFAKLAVRLALSPEERTRIAASGRVLYEQRFSWNSIVDQMFDVLNIRNEYASKGLPQVALPGIV